MISDALHTDAEIFICMYFMDQEPVQEEEKFSSATFSWLRSYQ